MSLNKNSALEALRDLIKEEKPGYHDCLDDGLPECAWCRAEKAIAAIEAEAGREVVLSWEALMDIYNTAVTQKHLFGIEITEEMKDRFYGWKELARRLASAPVVGREEIERCVRKAIETRCEPVNDHISDETGGDPIPVQLVIIADVVREIPDEIYALQLPHPTPDAGIEEDGFTEREKVLVGLWEREYRWRQELYNETNPSDYGASLGEIEDGLSQLRNEARRALAALKESRRV